MENVFKMSDEIIKNEYPDLELTDEETEILVEENFEETSEEIAEEVAEGVSELNSEAPVTYVLENDNSDIISELQKNNEYWNMFLDSYQVDVSRFLSPDTLIKESSNSVLYTSSNFVLENVSTLGRCVYFITLYPEHTYNISITNSFDSGNHKVVFGIYNNYSRGSTSLINFGSLVDGSIDFSYSPSSICYLVVNNAYATDSLLTDVVVSLKDSYVSYESYTLSELGNAVIETQKQITLIETCILMMVVIFLVHTITGKFIRRKK